MNLNLDILDYDLACIKCNYIRENGVSTVDTDEDISDYSSWKLAKLLNHFKEIQCENCGHVGLWKVFLIYANNNNPIRYQYRIKVYRENGKLKINDFSKSPISKTDKPVAHNKIIELLHKRKYREDEKYDNGNALFIVDFWKENKNYDLIVRQCDVWGILDEELVELLK